MMNRSLAFLERRLPAQRREPAVSIPTRTTTLRRQLCVNIEANGSGPSLRHRRRRRRDLQMPYPYPYPPMSMPVDYEQLQQLPQTKEDLHYNYPDPGDSFFPLDYPINRIKSGQEYAMYAPFLERSNLARSLYTNVNSSGSIDELKGIAGTLECSLHNFLTNEMMVHSTVTNETDEPVRDLTSSSQEESTRSRNYVSLGPQESKMHLLTNLMCDTIYRLNSFISSQTQIGEPQPTNNFGLGWEGLKSQRHLLHPSMMMPAKISRSSLPPVQTAEASTQTRFSVVRMPWLRERRRKRALRPTHIHLQNQGSSTEDLILWPRILEAITTNSSRENRLQTQQFEQQSSGKCMRDSGTTMWCPMDCCRGYCEYAQLGKRCDSPTCHKRNEEDANLPLQPPPLPTTAPPTFLTQDEDEYEVASKSIYIANADSQSTIGSSIMTTSCTSESRSEGGVQNTHLSYDYIEEEEEEVHPKRAGSLDDWYKSASKSLAELEEEQEFYKAMDNRRKTISSRNKRLQTEPATSSASSGVYIRATADMAVSTSDLNACRLRKPIKSVLKPRRVKSGQDFMESAPGRLERLTKVQFDKKVPHKLENIMGQTNRRAEIKTRIPNEIPSNAVASTLHPIQYTPVKRKYLQESPTKKKRAPKKFDCSPLINPTPSGLRKSPPYPSEWWLG
ncbi:uncharacterized protein LOC117582039 [Drosophila guanche]|uniref:uncharacterized protein LOC117582039 n=1 Tax=Drosophila guanche TaxID=7266 RepID=UPI0014708F08|nr:uncharacterized protein LOC117582039 [Drosophila guanche]